MKSAIVLLAASLLFTSAAPISAAEQDDIEAAERELELETLVRDAFARAVSRAEKGVGGSSLGKRLKTKENEIEAEQAKRLTIWKRIYRKFGIEIKAQTIMDALHELHGNPSTAKSGKLSQGKISNLSYSKKTNIAKEIDNATVHLRVKQLHQEREVILNRVVALQRKLTRKFFRDEIDKLLRTAKEPEKRMIEKLGKSKEFEI